MHKMALQFEVQEPIFKPKNHSPYSERLTPWDVEMQVSDLTLDWVGSCLPSPTQSNAVSLKQNGQRAAFII